MRKKVWVLTCLTSTAIIIGQRAFSDLESAQRTMKSEWEYERGLFTKIKNSSISETAATISGFVESIYMGATLTKDYKWEIHATEIF